MNEWHIGDPVDWGDGFMDAQNWGRSFEEDENDDETDYYSPEDEYSKKAWDYYMSDKLEDALYYINLALDLNSLHAGNWNRKAIILEYMKRYAESEECYNRSLELTSNNLVRDNKARMLYRWVFHLIEESKKLENGEDMLRQAYVIAVKAMDALPEKNSEEDPDKYIGLKESVNFYIDYERRYHQNLESLKKYDKSELFTITGRHFYKNNVALTPGKELMLVREPDNEFDSDAIAVYADGEKIGYVANKDYTKFELTSSASELKGKIPGALKAEYLLYLERYVEIQFAIGKII